MPTSLIQKHTDRLIEIQKSLDYLNDRIKEQKELLDYHTYILLNLMEGERISEFVSDLGEKVTRVPTMTADVNGQDVEEFISSLGDEGKKMMTLPKLHKTKLRTWVNKQIESGNELPKIVKVYYEEKIKIK